MKDAIQILQLLTPAFVAVVGLYLAFLGTRIKQVHVLVNAQRTVLESRVLQLEATIVSSNKDIPAHTSET